ncbi:MAG TPA: helix-turn-helix domain-containing protein [Methylomirabilota bacterium]|nr:helix-turn-helix domain-containing protein [Methylomirabilota bacterium]
MSLLALSSQERRVLEELITPAALTNEVRRAQALLWLDDGESPQAVAARLHVSRQTVYNWAARFKRRRGAAGIPERLADEKRSGRPGVFPRIIDPLIKPVLGKEPLEFGYEAHKWTPTLLMHYLRDVHQVMVCRASVSLALRRLGGMWEPPKRPSSEAFEVGKVSIEKMRNSGHNTTPNVPVTAEAGAQS